MAHDLPRPARETSRPDVLPLVAWMALGLMGCGGGSPTPTAATSPAPAVSGGTGWDDLGRVLAPADFGRPSGSLVGDPTGVLLPDGRIRLFVHVDGQGVWRAVSSDAQGTAFTVEGPCTLIPDVATNTMGTPWGEPRVVAIAGGLRMFYMQDRGIASATSSDHVTWRQEPGLRITAQQAGVPATTTGSLVAVAGGGWRMYFSELRDTPAAPATVMLSASSPDQLRWTMDPGVRIGPGAPHLDQNATDPFAMTNPDGSVTAWYFVQVAAGSSFQGSPGLYAATSADGLEFRTSTLDRHPGRQPERDRARRRRAPHVPELHGPSERAGHSVRLR
jgi:hypothetical protein